MNRLVVCFAVLAACVGPPLLEHGLRPLRDVSSPFGGLSASHCHDCHADEHTAWADSRHAQSWTNEIFRASVRTSDQAGWCRDCHAPLPEQASNAALRSEGVTCVVCHARGGELLSATVPSEEAKSRHPIRYEPALSGSEFCGGCHQFNLRPDHPMASPEAVQETLSEWQSSGATETCQSCHVQGHRFVGAHEPSFVRDAVQFSTELTRDSVRVTLSTTTPHRVPTGDPFRRLVWKVCTDIDCEAATAKRILARFHEGPEWHLAADTSLPSKGSRTLTAARPPEGGWWTLELHFGDPILEAGLAPEDVSTLLFRERIPPLEQPERDGEPEENHRPNEPE